MDELLILLVMVKSELPSDKRDLLSDKRGLLSDKRRLLFDECNLRLDQMSSLKGVLCSMMNSINV